MTTDWSQPKPLKTGNVRRSQRPLLTIGISVSGKNPMGAPFTEDTTTQVVNAHGALVLLKQMFLSATASASRT